MMRPRSIWLLVLFAALAMGWGLYRLLELRFAGGDVYPPYSTFRTDPLGARALFEAFELLPDHPTQRLLEDLNRLTTGRDTTLFVLGADASLDDVEESEAKEIERFMQEGGRVVLTFFPETGQPLRARWRAGESTNAPARGSRNRRPKQSGEESGKSGTEEKGAPEEESQSSADTNTVVSMKRDPTNAPPAKPRINRLDRSPGPDGERSVSLRERWGFGVDYQKLDENEDRVAEPVVVRRADNADVVPESLDWHSAAFFTTTNQAWRAFYRRADHPVLMERAYGRGSLVLASDSWFVSNEALRRDRRTALLAWLAGESRRLVFDETHLGVELEPGIATLAVRYRLHGLFASLLLLAGLFVWKNATSFVPAHAPQDPAADIVSGKDSASGFVNLLRRSIAPRDLLATCFAEWRKSGARGRHSRADRVLRMSAIVESQAAAPVDGYRELSRIVSEKDL